MEIVQLSDIHVGSQFREEVFEKVIDEINLLKPEAVVITGDLTNEGLVEQYEKCKKMVSQINVEKIIAISGNHDYRNTGYLLFKNYFPFKTENDLGNDVILITLNSTRPDRDDGEVGHKQTLWLERTLKKYENKFKIVAMHHHLIGIPDTGSDRLTVIDAGDVLRTVLDSNVSLVLCGHKHRPWLWDFNTLSIANAGTTSSERVRGFFENSYNIVNIENGTFRVDLKIVGGKRIPLRDIVKGYTRFSENCICIVIYLSLFTVKEINQAIVLQFGDPKRIINTPGLQVKIPFIQNVVYLDRRILSLDPAPEEVIASDQKRLIVDAYARFKIVDPLKFYVSVGDERVARSRLATIINSRLRSVLGKQSLATLLSEDRAKQMAIIQEGVNVEAEKFGIKIIDVRIKRADLPQANSEAIYKRMQTEREREAKEFRAKGAEMAVTITSTADKEVTVLLANAKKQSEIMKGEGDGQRNKIFAEAFGKDPDFFSFYRAMQAYEKALIGGDTSLILSPDSDFFKFFGNTGIIKEQ